MILIKPVQLLTGTGRGVALRQISGGVIPPKEAKMKRKMMYQLLAAGLVLALVGLGCQVASQALGQQEEPSQAVQAPEQAQPTEEQPAQPPEEAPAQPPEEAPAQEPGALPAAPEPTACNEPACIQEGNFILGRPAGGKGRDTIDPTSRFGQYGRRGKDVNYGVNFLNSTGTSVVAAADGVVVVAGDDLKNVYGLRPNDYGNLVILRHEIPGVDGPVFTLYAQLSEVLVAVDQTVAKGEEIAKSGSSGDVRGSTLHFEVRQGENTLLSARNPELWMELLEVDGQPTGALAGRIVNEKGEWVAVSNIVLERLAGAGLPAADQLYLKTYADLRLAGLEPWGESFAAGDLIPAEYQISFYHLNKLYQQVVEVRAGQLTLVNMQVP
jgi:murein DD-endopeptidase MepM/ murein hydrolase activator NlpD